MKKFTYLFCPLYTWHFYCCIFKLQSLCVTGKSYTLSFNHWMPCLIPRLLCWFKFECIHLSFHILVNLTQNHRRRFARERISKIKMWTFMHLMLAFESVEKLFSCFSAITEKNAYKNFKLSWCTIRFFIPILIKKLQPFKIP